MPIIISPSLLAADFLDLKSEIKAFNESQDIWIHLDIMDSHFVPNLTFGKPVLKQLHSLTPHQLDAHFMVSEPDFFVDEFKDLGLYNFTFHWEATVHHDRLIKKIKSLYPSVGISLNPSTPLEIVPDYLLHHVDVVLLMSVNPGFGGQSFIPEISDKVLKLHQRKLKHKMSFQIQVDGGINSENASQLIKNGAQNLVAGSFIFENSKKDYIHKINQLRKRT